MRPVSLVLLITLLTTFAVSSCGVSSDSIIGHWQLRKVTISSVYEIYSYWPEYLHNLRIDFSPDGTFNQTEDWGDDGFLQGPGTYKLDTNKLKLYYDRDIGKGFNLIPDVFVDSWALNVVDLDTTNNRLYHFSKLNLVGDKLVLTYMAPESAGGQTYFQLEFIRSYATAKDIRPEFIREDLD